MSENFEQKKELIVVREEISSTTEFLREKIAKAEGDKDREGLEKAVLLMETFDGTVESILDNYEAWVLISPDLMAEK